MASFEKTENTVTEPRLLNLMQRANQSNEDGVTGNRVTMATIDSLEPGSNKKEKKKKERKLNSNIFQGANTFVMFKKRKGIIRIVSLTEK